MDIKTVHPLKCTCVPLGVRVPQENIEQLL